MALCAIFGTRLLLAYLDLPR